MNKNKKEPIVEEEVKQEGTQAEIETEQVDEKQEEQKPSEVEKLKEENDKLNEKILRNFAEFDNYKKRTAKEKEDMMLYSKSLCIKEVLSVVDNFERALEVDCKDEEFKKGMEMIFNQLEETLKKLDVHEIEALNKPFDPDIHNAVNQVEDENFGENTVCEVFQKGYKVGDKVIRHSMVVVANP